MKKEVLKRIEEVCGKEVASKIKLTVRTCFKYESLEGEVVVYKKVSVHDGIYDRRVMDIIDEFNEKQMEIFNDKQAVLIKKDNEILHARYVARRAVERYSHEIEKNILEEAKKPDAPEFILREAARLTSLIGE